MHNYACAVYATEATHDHLCFCAQLFVEFPNVTTIKEEKHIMVYNSLVPRGLEGLGTRLGLQVPEWSDGHAPNNFSPLSHSSWDLLSHNSICTHKYFTCIMCPQFRLIMEPAPGDVERWVLLSSFKSSLELTSVWVYFALAQGRPRHLATAGPMFGVGCLKSQQMRSQKSQIPNIPYFAQIISCFHTCSCILFVSYL